MQCTAERSGVAGRGGTPMSRQDRTATPRPGGHPADRSYTTPTMLVPISKRGILLSPHDHGQCAGSCLKAPLLVHSTTPPLRSSQCDSISGFTFTFHYLEFVFILLFVSPLSLAGSLSDPTRVQLTKWLGAIPFRLLRIIKIYQRSVHRGHNGVGGDPAGYHPAIYAGETFSAKHVV